MFDKTEGDFHSDYLINTSRKKILFCVDYHSIDTMVVFDSIYYIIIYIFLCNMNLMKGNPDVFDTVINRTLPEVKILICVCKLNIISSCATT